MKKPTLTLLALLALTLTECEEPTKEHEVIGNIFETPDLLNGK